MSKTNLSGNGTALITPFTPEGAIGFIGFGKLLDFQIANGTQFFVCCGITGEDSTLEWPDKLEITTQILELAKKQAIIVNVSSNNTSEMLEAATALIQEQRDKRKPLPYAFIVEEPYLNHRRQFVTLLFVSDKLTQINFSLNEAKVYSSLLELGETSAGNIIKETQLHRSVVYETLDKLISKKLAFKITKRKIAYFQTTDPNVILERTKEQQKLAMTLVPELKRLGISGLPEINIYEGVESYRKFWIEIVKRLPIGSIDFVAGSIGDKWIEYMGKDKLLYDELRRQRKIKWKMIVFEKNKEELELQKKESQFYEYRLIKKDTAFDGNFNVFNDDILILQSATEPMIIEIKPWSGSLKIFSISSGKQENPSNHISTLVSTKAGNRLPAFFLFFQPPSVQYVDYIVIPLLQVQNL